MFKNEYTLEVNLKKSHMIVPQFVQFDNAKLIFEVFDGSKPFDFTNFLKAEVSHKLLDGTVITRNGQIEVIEDKEVVSYIYSGEEMAFVGNIDTCLSLFSQDEKRVSIPPFKVEIINL